MNRLRAGLARLVAPLTRRRRERDLREQLASHLQMRVDDDVRAGVPVDEARRRARAALGSADAAIDAWRDRHGLPLVEHVVRDLRYGFRMVARNRGFAAVAIATLTLGISATTIVFSAVNRVLLHPLPFKDGDRLVYVMQGSAKRSFLVMPSATLVGAWQQRAHLLDGTQAYFDNRVHLHDAGDTLTLSAVMVRSSTFLEFFGLRPEKGRFFTTGEMAPGGSPVVLLGDEFWRRRYGGRPDAVGATLTLDRRAYTIIGVMPESIGALDEGDVWMPVSAADFDPDTAHYSVIARLRTGVSAVDAQQELSAIERWTRDPADPFADFDARVFYPQRFINTNLRTALPVLFAAVAFVLLIACVNVMLLLLARGAARERELAVRLSLGAGRGRLVSQLVTETVVMTAAAASLALLLARWGVSALLALRPAALSDLDHVSVDGRVVWFAIAVSAVAALVAGLLPAFRATDLSIAPALRSGAPSIAGRGSAARLRALLLAAEMMFSIVLLTGAGLLVRSLIAMQHADLGFRPDGLVTVRETIPPHMYDSRASRAALTDAILARVRALPGVTAATVAMSTPPAYGVGGWNDVETSPGGSTPPIDLHGVVFNSVRPEYFDVLGIRVLHGRTFSGDEDHGNSNVLILSRGLASALFAGSSPIGRRIRVEGHTWQTVVGVVDDVAAEGIAGPSRGLQSYSPYAGGPQPTFGLPQPGAIIVRATTDPAALAPSLRAVIRSLDQALPAPQIATVDSAFAARLAAPRFDTVLLTLFAIVSMILASIGLFGVTSYAVARRTREIGICVALGARGTDVRNLVVVQAMLPTLAGVAAGLGAAVFVTRVLRSLLYGVAPLDPAVYVAAAGLLSALALLASYLPARRATRVDPWIALRAE